MIIVWGWGSYNRRNAKTAPGQCGGCGHIGLLRSYDELSCFSFFYVPLLPLARRHVWNDCPKCDRGKRLSLGKWRKWRRSDYEESLTTLDRDSTDREAALAALGWAAETGEMEALREVGGRILRDFGGDAEMLGALGGVLAFRFQDEEAVGCFRKSLALREDPEVRLSLAKTLLQLSRLEETASELDVIAERHPDHESSTIAHLREAGEKLQQLPPELRGPRTSRAKHLQPVKPRPRKLIPVLLFPALLLFLLAQYGFDTARATVDTLYLVNGLDEPYAVLVNGESVELRAGGRRKVQVEFGEIRVEDAPGGPTLEPATIELDVPLLKRAMYDEVVIINPDRTAFLAVEDAVYGQTQHDSGGFEFLFGKPVYEVGEIDYLFRAAPEQIQMSSRQEVARKRALRYLQGHTPAERLMLAGQNSEGGRELAKYTRALFVHWPEDLTVLQFLMGFEEPDECIALFESRLDDRPVLVQIHRFYQELVGAHDPERDLVTEYRARLGEEPENRPLAYLVGRILSDEDPEEARRYYSQATQEPDPCGYGHLGLSWAALREGQLDVEVQEARRALLLEPENVSFQSRLRDALLASRCYAEQAERNREQLAREGVSTQEICDQVICLIRSDQEDEADRIIQERLQAIRTGDYPPEMRTEGTAMLASARAVARRDREAYVQATGRPEIPVWLRFRAGVVTRDGEMIAELLKEDEEELLTEVGDHLLLYSLRSLAGEEAGAQEQLSLALGQLESGSKRGRELAAAFRSETPPDLGKAVDLAAGTGRASEALFALAVRFPELRRELLTAALRFSYENPYLEFVLEPLLEQS